MSENERPASTPTPPPSAAQPVWVRAERADAAVRHGPTVKGLVLNLIVLALIGAGVAFIVAPVVTFFGIRSAAEARDVAALSQLVDFDAVRSSLRPQLSGRVETLTPPPSFMEDPIGAVRRRFEDSVTPPPANTPSVEAYLSPGAILALTRGFGHDSIIGNPAGPSTTGVMPYADSGDPWPRPVFWSVNRVRLAIPDSVDVPTVFTFQRMGWFHWRLVHVGLPHKPAAPAPR